MKLLILSAVLITLLNVTGCIVKQANAKTITLTQENVMVFETDFNQESVSKLSFEALIRDIPKGDLYLFLDTPGGSVDAGIDLVHAINTLKRKVHTISYFAASMGFHTVQGVNGHRYILKNGTLMSHKARGGFQGEFPGQLDKRYNLYKDRLARLDARVVRRTRGKQTIESYTALYENEYWCDAQKCVDDGFADLVVNVRCDKSLNGTKKVLAARMRMFGSTIDIYAIKSKCPIIRGPLNIKVYIDGKPMNKVIKKLNKVKEITEAIDTKITEIKSKNNVTRQDK